MSITSKQTLSECKPNKNFCLNKGNHVFVIKKNMDEYKRTGKRDCLILSVGSFVNGRNRDNCQEKTDAKRLEKTFQKLDFDCHTFYGDIPLSQAEREIKELSKCQTGKDMFCLCLLTHGDWTERGQIMLFSDGNFTTLERLTEPIMRCPKLENRPKICFINACRGSQNEFMQVDADEIASDMVRERLHSARDRAIFWSTPPGNKSYRPIGQLSFFIEHLCDIFDRFGKQETLDDLVKRVNRQMSDEPPISLGQEPTKRVRLAPTFEHCLVKNLRFCDIFEPARPRFQQPHPGENSTEMDQLKRSLELEIGLNRRLRHELDTKNKESIDNLIQKPTAKFQLKIPLPDQSKNQSESFSRETKTRGCIGKVGLGNGY